jgi:hypothetical protein
MLHHVVADASFEHEYHHVLGGTHTVDDATLRIEHCSQFTMIHVQRPEAAAPLDIITAYLIEMWLSDLRCMGTA